MSGFIKELAKRKYLLILLLATLSDLVAAVNVISITREWYLLAMLTGFVIPFLHFLSIVWFVRADTTIERLAITFYDALGIMGGIWLSIWLCK